MLNHNHNTAHHHNNNPSQDDDAVCDAAAHAFLLLHQYDKSFALYDLLAQSQPLEPKWLLGRALCALGSRRPQSALADVKSILALPHASPRIQQAARRLLVRAENSPYNAPHNSNSLNPQTLNSRSLNPRSLNPHPGEPSS